MENMNCQFLSRSGLRELLDLVCLNESKTNRTFQKSTRRSKILDLNIPTINLNLAGQRIMFA